MKNFFLLLCLLIVSSVYAINNNVELISNTDFSSNITPAQTVSGTSTAGVWFAGDNTTGTWNTAGGFIADAATGAFVTSTGAVPTNVYDNYLGQITTETGVNSGRYHFSINASGTQPFYIKISSVNAIGTELSYVLRNASSSAIVKQGTADYAGYSLKITPTGTATTYSADLDLANATPLAVRIYLVFPKVGNVTVDDISLKRIKDIPTVYYVRPSANLTAWANFPSDQIISADLISAAIDPTYTYYLAPGTYTATTLSITTGKIYGGFSGNETSIDLNARAISDKDGNGIVEPWEFTNEAIITTSTATYAFTQTGISSGSRMVTIQGSGGELNGVTITDLNFLTYAGPICLGLPSGTPTAANNVSGNEGILRLCTVKRIKSAIGIVMSTNKYSVIDRCLIESNVITGTNTGGAVFMNLCGGKLTGSVVRNNSAAAATGRAGGVFANSLASTDMDAIVENSIIYNNYAGANGGAIRGEAQSGKRGIQIVNCTVVNNQTATATTSVGSVEFINNGLIANSIIVGDPSAEIRPNNANNYLLNNIYGEYASSAGAINGSGNVTGKVTSNLNFKNPTSFYGVMIPDYTTPYDAAKYDEIRKANFFITSASSPAVTTAGASSLGTSYTVSSTTTSISETVPTTDAYNTTRSGNITIGAYQFDNTLPTVSITSVKGSTTAANPIPVTITFSEPVVGFDVTDLVVGNGTAGSFVAVSPTVYTANITPASLGLVSVDIASFVATDASGNGNQAATQFTRTYTDVTTALHNVVSSRVYASESEIIMEGINGQAVSVYSVAGALLHAFNSTNDKMSIPASQGVYIVSIADKRFKVVVK